MGGGDGKLELIWSHAVTPAGDLERAAEELQGSLSCWVARRAG